MEAGDQEYQQLFQIFREECREHIQNLNDGLLALERQPKEAPLDGILRSAHSLKGAARMMGLKAIETLSHYLETLLTQLIRSEKEVTSTIMDSLYKGVDAISNILSALEERKEPESMDEILVQLKTAVGEKTPSEISQVRHQPDARSKPLPSSVADLALTRKEQSSILTTVRVQTERLDTLINHVGELLVSKIEALDNLREIERNLDLLEDWRKKLSLDAKQSLLLTRLDALSEELYNVFLRLSDNSQRLERLVDDIHEGVKDLRLLPLSTILDPFPRMVRDLSHDLGKDVELILEGTSTRLDKKILEELRDPLIHLVRNSIDHGIESPEERRQKGKPQRGKIIIAARQEGGRILVSATDDGRGLDRQIIEGTAVRRGMISAEEIGRLHDEAIWDLIFRPGFSTAGTVTELSGRGVGLDAVLAKVESLKGFLRVESKAGEGITFSLSFPLTLSTIHALLFQVNGTIFCLPTDMLEKTLLLAPDHITSVEGKTTVIINEEPTAFSWLADVLNLPKEDTKNGTIPALLLSNPRGKAIFGVDALLGEEEIVVKGLGRLLNHIPYLSGGSILGRGEIALILNPNDLFRSLSHHSGIHPPSAPSPKSRPSLPSTKKTVLVVEDSLTTRTLERNILEAAGFDVTTAIDGEEALIKLHEKSFDIVITDIQMPRLDGFALTERIKKDERFKDIPVILVTALQTESDKRRGIEAGADAYITKATFDQKHLLGIIQRFI